MSERSVPLVVPAHNLLERLKASTEARIALGRSGAALPTAVVQTFLLDHARAREAVWRPLDCAVLRQDLAALNLPCLELDSLASDRATYLRRPDLGRALSGASEEILRSLDTVCDVALVIGDGLSATAIESNAIAFLSALCPLLEHNGLTTGPVVIARQARVALGDPVGVAQRARAVVMLIGERPGLSAADSLGVYITYAPAVGLPDSRRNCLSNIRDGGLSPERAAEQTISLLRDMMEQGTSGVTLIESASPPQALLP